MKVVIIGLGSIAKKHIKALLSIDSTIEIFALRSSTNSPSYDNVADIYRYEKIELIKPNFVIVSNPTSLHYKTLDYLADYNIPLFIEKPILNSLEKIEPLLKKIKSRQILTYVGCNLRFLDSLNFAKSYIDQKTTQLNEANIYVGSYLPNWRPQVDFRKSYSAIPELGGGVHLDLIHELDYIYWFFGMPSQIQSTLKSNSSLNIASIDYANYILDYKKFIVNTVLNYYRVDLKRTAEFVFEDETILIDLMKNQVSNHKGELLYKGSVNILDTYLLQMQYFIDLLKGNKKTSFNTFEDGVNILKICLNE